MEKRREANCLGWKNDERRIVWDGKTTSGELSGMEKRREGNCMTALGLCFRSKLKKCVFETYFLTS